MTGIFDNHPPLSEYGDILDINGILSRYVQMVPNNEFPFKRLCKKIIILFGILRSRRKEVLLL